MFEGDAGDRRRAPARRRRSYGLTGNLNALRSGAYSDYTAPIYRSLPPPTRAFLRIAIGTALAAALSDLPSGRHRLAVAGRQRARLRALYGVVELLASIDFSKPKTNAGVHLAVVRALGPVFLDPSFLQGESRALPVEWPSLEDEDGPRALRRRRHRRHEAY